MVDFNINTALKIAKAVVAPIPTAIESAVEAGVDYATKPAAPPPAKEKTLDDARTGAQAAWNEPKPAESWRTITHNGKEIKVPVKDDQADLKAVAELTGNTKLEAKALAALPDDNARAQYEALSHQFEDDPQAHLALQMLLLDGKLTAPKSLKGDQTLLGGLTTLSKNALEPPLDNKTMLREAVRECADPTQIKQGKRDTCTAGSLQILMAQQNPAEYVRILNGLSVKGGFPVELADGKTKMKRVPEARDVDDSGRTSTSRIFQGAVMSMEAEMRGQTYDPQTDLVNLDESHTGHGIDPGGVTLAADALMGQPHDHVELAVKRTAMFKDVDAQLAHGPGPVTLHVATTQPDGSDGDARDVKVLRKLEGGKYLVEDKGIETEMTPYELFHEVRTGPGYDRKQETGDAMAKIKDSLQRHEPVPVSLRWGEFGNDGHTHFDGATDPNHEVLVTAIDPKTGNVTIRQSHGDEETMTEQQFRARFNAAAPRA